MAKTIPQLTDATTVNAADELVIQQGGITKRATGAELAKGLNAINGTINVKDFGAVGDGVADDTAAINAAISHAIATGKRVAFPFAATIRVPEDAPTLQAAINAIYPDPTVGFLLTIRISAGHQIAAGFVVQNGDYGNVQITSQDATVEAASGFAGVSGGDSFSASCIMSATDATAPRWNVFVDMKNRGGGLAYNRAVAFVGNGKGVHDSTEFGLYLMGQSKVFASNSVFTKAEYGNRITLNSMLNAPQANFSQSKSATYLGSNTTCNLHVSRGSVAYITGTSTLRTNLSNGLGQGLRVARSFCSASDIEASNNGSDGIAIYDMSTVGAVGAVCNNNGQSGVFVSGGSQVDFASGTATGNATRGIFANTGARASARLATLTGNATGGIVAAEGSTVSATGANCRIGAIDNVLDIRVLNGSIIHADAATGGTNITPLTLNANGLIFK